VLSRRQCLQKPFARPAPSLDSWRRNLSFNYALPKSYSATRFTVRYGMHALNHWEPSIDWSKFNREGLSSGMRSAFESLVILCHGFEHWQTEFRQANRFARMGQGATPRETKQVRADWHRAALRYENHRNRAEFLAYEKLCEMRMLAAKGGGADQKISRHMDTLINARRGQESGNYSAGALTQFPGEKNLRADLPL
jgi:hypothetical protein